MGHRIRLGEPGNIGHRRSANPGSRNTRSPKIRRVPPSLSATSTVSERRSRPSPMISSMPLRCGPLGVELMFEPFDHLAFAPLNARHVDLEANPFPVRIRRRASPAMPLSRSRSRSCSAGTRYSGTSRLAIGARPTQCDDPHLAIVQARYLPASPLPRTRISYFSTSATAPISSCSSYGLFGHDSKNRAPSP